MLVNDVWVHSIDKLEQEHNRGEWTKKYQEILTRRKAWVKEHIEKIQKCRKLMALVVKEQRCEHDAHWVRVDEKVARRKVCDVQSEVPIEVGSVEWFKQCVERMDEMVWNLIPAIDDLVERGPDGQIHLNDGDGEAAAGLLVKVYGYMEGLTSNIDSDMENILRKKAGITRELNRSGHEEWVKLEKDENGN
jgi:hypothetical protein